MSFFDPIFMRRGRGVLAVLVALAAVAGRADAAPKPKTLIKFATVAPEGTTWMNIMHDFDEELRRETENRVGFKFYPGQVQGDEEEVLRKMRNGQLHAGGFTGLGLGKIAPEFRVLELPFLFRTLDEVDHVREAMDSYYRNIFDEKGFVFLGWGDVDFIYVYSIDPIRTPEDLQRAKIWTWSGDKLAELFFKAFDVSPIPLALPDVLTSLQTGVVNAVYAPPLACIALQWFTRVKYMTNVPITYGFGGILVTKKAIDGVSAEDMATMQRLGGKYSETLIARTRVENVEAISEIQGEGVQLLQVDPAVTNIFFDVGRGAWQDGVDRMYPADLLGRVSGLVEEYRSTHDEAKK